MDVSKIIREHDLHIEREVGMLRGRHHDDRVDVYLKFVDSRWQGCNRYCEDENGHDPMCPDEVADELFLHYTGAAGVLTKGEILETGPSDLEMIRHT